MEELVVFLLIPTLLHNNAVYFQGVLTVNPNLQGYQVLLRKSQKKFESRHRTIEVLSYSKLNSAYLNQQIILLLSSRGVLDEVFTDLMTKALCRAAEIVTDPSVACRHLQGIGFKLDANAFVLLEPFLRTLLQYRYRQEVGDLVRRSRIFVEEGCVLLGVADDFGVLHEGEVFIQIDPSSSKHQFLLTEQIIDSTVIVTKNPCLHPGDILRLKGEFHCFTSHKIY